MMTPNEYPIHSMETPEFPSADATRAAEEVVSIIEKYKRMEKEERQRA